MFWQSKRFLCHSLMTFLLFHCCKGFIVMKHCYPSMELSLFVNVDPFSMPFIGSSHTLYDCLGLNMSTCVGNFGL